MIKLYVCVCVFYLTMVKLTILKLIMVQLLMKKLIKIKTNHN
jgi:hypothetical protein